MRAHIILILWKPIQSLQINTGTTLRWTSNVFTRQKHAQSKKITSKKNVLQRKHCIENALKIRSTVLQCLPHGRTNEGRIKVSNCDDDVICFLCYFFKLFKNVFNFQLRMLFYSLKFVQFVSVLIRRTKRKWVLIQHSYNIVSTTYRLCFNFDSYSFLNELLFSLQTNFFVC